MKTLLRILGFGSRADRAHGGSLYADAQYAGWVAPPAELSAKRAPINPAPADSADPEALVARFYKSQEC